MNEAKAQDRLMERYGLLKGCRLLAYAAQIHILGEDEFARRSTRQTVWQVKHDMAVAGVEFDAIEWGPVAEGGYRLRLYRDEMVRRGASRRRTSRSSGARQA